MATERHIGAFFGEPWPSGVCDSGRQVPTPVGEPCGFCHEPIEERDQGSFIGAMVLDEPNGSYILAEPIEMDRMVEARPALVPQHRECSLRSVMGGIGHLLDHEYWCSHHHDPDGGRTPRQSSIEVWEWIHAHGIPGQ